MGGRGVRSRVAAGKMPDIANYETELDTAPAQPRTDTNNLRQESIKSYSRDRLLEKVPSQSGYVVLSDYSSWLLVVVYSEAAPAGDQQVLQFPTIRWTC